MSVKYGATDVNGKITEVENKEVNDVENNLRYPILVRCYQGSLSNSRELNSVQFIQFVRPRK